MPIYENDMPEFENEKGKDNNKNDGSKSFFQNAKGWLSEKVNSLRSTLSNVIEKIKEKMPQLVKPGGFLDRIETRVLGGREAYNHLYSQVSKEEADKAVFKQENQPSVIETKAKVEKEIGKSNGQQVLLQENDLSKRYIASAYTMSVNDMQGTVANYTIKSTDELSSLKIPGKEPIHGFLEYSNVADNNFAFKCLMNKLKADIANGKEAEQILKGVPYTNKEAGKVTLNGSFDIHARTRVTEDRKDDIMKVKCVVNKDNSVDLTVYNFSTKSSIEIRGAEDFTSAISSVDELLKASEYSLEKFGFHTPSLGSPIDANDLMAGDVVYVDDYGYYEIQSSVKTESGEVILSCRALDTSYDSTTDTFNCDYADSSSQIVEISGKDVLATDIIHRLREALDEKILTDEFTKKVSETEAHEWAINDIVENYKGERFVVVGIDAPSEEGKSVQLELAQLVIVAGDEGPSHLSYSLDETIKKDANRGLTFVGTFGNAHHKQEPEKAEVSESEINTKEENKNKEDEQNKSSDEHSEKSDEKEQADKTADKHTTPEKDKKISVGDVVSDGKHNYRITKIDTVSQTFHVKPVSFNDTKGYWLSEENSKTNKISLDRENDFTIVKKAGEKPKVNEAVITDDGKIGILTNANKKIGTVNIDGLSFNYHYDTLQRYEPPQIEKDEKNSTETVSKKDVLEFEADGHEEPPSLENASEYVLEDAALENEKDNLDYNDPSIEEF